MIADLAEKSVAIPLLIAALILWFPLNLWLRHRRKRSAQVLQPVSAPSNVDLMPLVAADYFYGEMEFADPVIDPNFDDVETKKPDFCDGVELGWAEPPLGRLP